MKFEMPKSNETKPLQLFFYLRRLFNKNQRKFHYTKHSKAVLNNRLRMCIVNCNFHHDNYKIVTEPLSKAAPVITDVETVP